MSQAFGIKTHILVIGGTTCNYTGISTGTRRRLILYFCPRKLFTKINVRFTLNIWTAVSSRHRRYVYLIITYLRYTYTRAL